MSWSIYESIFQCTVTDVDELCQTKCPSKFYFLGKDSPDIALNFPKVRLNLTYDRNLKDDMWAEGDDFKRSMYDGASYGPAAYKRDNGSPTSRFLKLAYQWDHEQNVKKKSEFRKYIGLE